MNAPFGKGEKSLPVDAVRDGVQAAVWDTVGEGKGLFDPWFVFVKGAELLIVNQ